MSDQPGSIRRITGEEAADVFLRLPAYAFASTPPLPADEAKIASVRASQNEVFYAAYEGDQALACACYTPLGQNVRGALRRCGGVYDVATHPGARRKGYARGLMTALFAAMRADGCAVSSLYPFRESFYERLGYVTFPQMRLARLLPANLGAALRAPVEGEVDLLPMSEHAGEYLEFMQAVRARVHGMALFEPPGPAHLRESQNERWLAVARAGRRALGMMVYTLKSERPTVLHMTVRRFYALNAQGRYLLLDWIARHVDQAVDVEMVLPAFETPETWLADAKVETRTFHFPPMGRVIDLAGLNGLPVEAGRVTVRFSDPYAPWNAGVWRLEGQGGRLSVTPGGQPECDLTVQALSALVYGAHDPGDFLFRGWGDPGAETQATLRGMFRAAQPYLHEYF